MTKVEIFGVGCAKCEELAANVHTALDRLGIRADVVKVASLEEMRKRGVLMTPGLAVDGELKFCGRTAGVDELAALFSPGTAVRPSVRPVAWKVATVAFLAVAVAGILCAKSVYRRSTLPALPKGVPVLIELSAGECEACVRLRKALDELAREQGGRIHVECINVLRTRAAQDRYRIETTPTLVVLDRDGRESFRLIGDVSKEEILDELVKHGLVTPSQKQ